MRILITGASGFAGRHLAAFLRDHQPDAELHGTIYGGEAPGGIVAYPCDLRDTAAVERLLTTVQPDQIYHLAGSANVQASAERAWGTIENNTYSLLRLLRACLKLAHPPRILAVTTGEFYQSAEEGCAVETTPINPTNPYAVSKIAQEMLAVQYAAHLPIIRARPFNHSGEGQASGFVLPDFASQIAQIELGMTPDPVVKCRNLKAERDFTHVRDVVRAYVLLMAMGIPGEAYNVGSGQAVSIEHMLTAMIALSTYSRQIAPSYEAAQIPDRKCGDAAKLRALTGWQPEIALEALLMEVLDDWRKRVAAGELSSA